MHTDFRNYNNYSYSSPETFGYDMLSYDDWWVRLFYPYFKLASFWYGINTWKQIVEIPHFSMYFQTIPFYLLNFNIYERLSVIFVFIADRMQNRN